jgi:pimeloyl-ACP methyl ester carboxylesterase
MTKKIFTKSTAIIMALAMIITIIPVVALSISATSVTVSDLAGLQKAINDALNDEETTIIITNSFAITEQIIIPANKNIILKSGSTTRTLTRDYSVHYNFNAPIRVINATLTIENLILDSIFEEDNFVGSSFGPFISLQENSILIMNSGEIVNLPISSGAVGLPSSSTFIMNGGKINKSAIALIINGNFTMNGGEIINSGGVSLWGGTFIMNGGFIGSSSDGYSEGVRINPPTEHTGSSTFIMNGGEISGNHGAGVLVYGDSTFKFFSENAKITDDIIYFCDDCYKITSLWCRCGNDCIVDEDDMCNARGDHCDYDGGSHNWALAVEIRNIHRGTETVNRCLKCNKEEILLGHRHDMICVEDTGTGILYYCEECDYYFAYPYPGQAWGFPGGNPTFIHELIHVRNEYRQGTKYAIGFCTRCEVEMIMHEIDDNYPIIVIPGIMGSKLFNSSGNVIWNDKSSNWSRIGLAFNSNLIAKPPLRVDTLTLEQRAEYGYGASNLYKSLIDYLCFQFPEREVWFFSYDWRRSNEDNAKNLKDFINIIMGAEKVDLVCHSMGGLIASYYYQMEGNKANKIITAGTPYEGSPESLQRAVGFFTGNIGGASSFLSLPQLAPTENYVSRNPMRRPSMFIWQSNPDMTLDEYKTLFNRIFTVSFSNTKYFHDSLHGNNGFNALLEYENAYFSIGIGQKTISSVRIDDRLFSLTVDDLRYEVTGDGTVPLLSATMMNQVVRLPYDRYRFFTTDHEGVIGSPKSLDTLQYAHESLFWIESILDGSNMKNSLVAPNNINKDGFIVIRAACPVDIKVTRNGEELNSNSNDFSDFTSFGRMDIIGCEDEPIKMFCIDDEGDFEIIIQGTGNGTMDYAIRLFDENGELQEERVAKNVPITTNTIITTTTDFNDEIVLVINENGDISFINLEAVTPPTDNGGNDNPPSNGNNDTPPSGNNNLPSSGNNNIPPSNEIKTPPNENNEFPPTNEDNTPPKEDNNSTLDESNEIPSSNESNITPDGDIDNFQNDESNSFSPRADNYMPLIEDEQHQVNNADSNPSTGVYLPFIIIIFSGALTLLLMKKRREQKL